MKKIKIGEAYKYVEKREQEEAIIAYRKKGSKLPEESIILLEKLRKERVTNKRKNTKEKTIHSFTLDLDFEMLLLKHSESALQIKTEDLHGTLEMPSRIVNFPKTLRIKNKSEAVDLLDILQDGDTNFSGNSLDIAYNALNAAGFH
jgi:hypothetical protein